MANTISNVIDKIFAEALATLRENAVTPQLIHNYSHAAAVNKGNVIDIPVPATQTVGAITNSNTPPSNTDKTPTTVQITMDQHFGTNFHLSDIETTRIKDGQVFIPLQLGEAIKAMGNKIDTTVLALGTAVGNYVGTAGTTPFASAAQFATDWQKGARKYLNQNLAPMSNRYVVLDEDADGAVGSLDQFVLANQVGSREGILNGEIGRRVGADWFMNQNVPSFDSNVPTGALINDAAHAVGATTLTIDTVTGTIKVGDVFTVAGDTQTYTITSASQTVPGIFPASKVALADNAALTFKADHVNNLAFHRDAFAIASAPLMDSDFGMANTIVLPDPVTGIQLRLEIRRDYKQTTWEVDALWGVKAIRPELACRIAG